MPADFNEDGRIRSLEAHRRDRAGHATLSPDPEAARLWRLFALRDAGAGDTPEDLAFGLPRGWTLHRLAEVMSVRHSYEIVMDDSICGQIPEGSSVVIADTAVLGYRPTAGDLVTIADRAWGKGFREVVVGTSGDLELRSSSSAALPLSSVSVTGRIVAFKEPGAEKYRLA